MLFNSLHFLLIFLPVVILFYYLLPHRFRNGWLLFASCYFYMSFVPYYILILALTILVDYVAGIFISGAAGSRRRLFLVVSIVVNVSILAFFKYFNFLRDNLSFLAIWTGYSLSVPALAITLPIGLSFHTFQSMSYTIEVYRGNQEAERNLGIFALYVLFFPQLVAGPIERPQNLLHQFRKEHTFDYQRVVGGLRLILWGLIQKMVVADRLSEIIDPIYGNPTQHQGLSLVIATVLFAFQIYCDFAGYSDVALGLAQVLGFKLMTNFRQPYLARSVAEFWKRWHISLSTWFRDYLYFPLGGSRFGKVRHSINVMMVFAVSGLWHDADWKFVIWGSLNGLYVLMSGLTQSQHQTDEGWKHRLNGLIQRLVTFAMVCTTWVFFRARSVPESFQILRNMFPLGEYEFGKLKLLTVVFLVAFVLVAQVIRERGHVNWFSAQPTWLRWCAYTAGLTALLLTGQFSSRQFIYFQF